MGVPKSDPIWVVFPQHKVDRVKSFIQAIIERKRTEKHHQDDDDNEDCRWTIGKLGEAAFEHHFNLNFVDWSVDNSLKMAEPDLNPIGLNVGIKTVLLEHRNHLVHKVVRRPEVLITAFSETSYLILGFIPSQTLRDHQNIDNVLNAKIRAAGFKTALDTKAYGYVVPFQSIDELRVLAAEDEAVERQRKSA